MRPRFVISVLLLASACLALFWFVREGRRPTVDDSTEHKQPPTNQVQAKRQPAPHSTNGIVSTKTNAPTAEEVREFLEATHNDPTYEWTRPINFYGKVVDENDQHVEGAIIRFTWNDLSEKGTSQRETTSNPNGLFSLLDQKGKRLYVEIQKHGYYRYLESSFSAFEYANPYERFYPDSNSPVIFRLKKARNLEPLIAFSAALPVANDGMSTEFDLLAGRRVEPGSIQFQCEVGPSDEPSRRHDWTFRISVPTGGLIERTNPLDFEAPLDGYVEQAVHAALKDDGPWSSQVTGSYFMRFGNPVRYARIDVAFTAQRKEYSRNSGVIMSYWVNPSGSRNLEADPAKMLERIPPHYLRSGLSQQGR